MPVGKNVFVEKKKPDPDVYKNVYELNTRLIKFEKNVIVFENSFNKMQIHEYKKMIFDRNRNSDGM